MNYKGFVIEKTFNGYWAYPIKHEDIKNLTGFHSKTLPLARNRIDKILKDPSKRSFLNI